MTINLEVERMKDDIRRFEVENIRPYNFPTDTVRVGALDYKISWLDGTWTEDSDVVGKCTPRDQEIKICREKPVIYIAGTLLHEVFHALAWHYRRWGMKINSDDAANICGEGMTMFWRDNPAVFRWWVQVMEGEI